MLVLSRKVGENILVGDNIIVRVLDCRGGRIRLGIEAPADVTILRGEIEAIRKDFLEEPTSEPSLAKG